MNQPQHNPEPGAPERIIQVAERDRSYLRLLLGLLMSVTIFEGYDTTIFHLCTPDIARTFHLNTAAVGTLASQVRAGGMAAFFIVMYSDRIGRKPLVSATVLFYTLFTLFTALSQGLVTFTIFQSSAQLFLSAEFGIAIIMISEEFPASSRGTGVAMLNMVGLLGVVAGGALYGKIVDTRWGWRGMYLIGILPLLLVAYLRRSIKETARFEALHAQRELDGNNSKNVINALRLALEPLRGPYRGRILLVAMLWNCVGLVGAPAVTFFSLYAKRDHHWTSPQISQAVVIAYLFGTLGHLLAGWSLDRVGRKLTTGISYIVGAVSILALFKTDSHAAMLTAMVITVFAFQGARTATATYSSELFPTEIRATSYSLTVQLFGQISSLLTPYIVGKLSNSMGLGDAVAIVSIGPIIGALLVWLFAPETRGLSLEELQAPAAAG